MPDINSSTHALLTMICRCLSGQWQIDATWLMQHADLMLRGEKGEDMSSKWPKMSINVWQKTGDTFSSVGPKDTVGKGQALGVVTMIGPIYKYGWSSSKMFNQIASLLASDERIGGLKVIVDSPGGMVHGTRETYQGILNFPKPVLSTIDGYAASAAYYGISGSTRIVATQPNDQIGSIGTYRTMADWVAFYASMGLNLYEIYADASSEKNEDFRQAIESKGKKTDLAQKEITTYNDLFIADVKAGRGKRLTGKGQDPLKGRLFFTPESIENGLIDEMISERETLSLLADMVATTKQSTIIMTPLEQFLQILKGDKPGAESQAQTTQQLTDQVSQLTAQLNTANGQVATLTSERDTLQGQVATLTTEKEGLEAQVVAYGSQPGAMGTKTKKEKDEVESESEKTWETVVAGLEHNKAADELFS